ncbi:MAG: 4Fe-4S dicluster domain-containing protein [Flavobacteriales bacterium]|nr:4Fe-4S dicluster domain-containing protein [Flavobacteriales bacterium]
MANNKNKDDANERRGFLKKGLALGLGSLVAGKMLYASDEGEPKKPKEKIKVLTQEGKLIEVDKPTCDSCEPPKGIEARKGIDGRKFTMVIDLSKCTNARKCVEACQHGHDLLPSQEFMQVNLIKDTDYSDPYWQPKSCFHCDNPPCVKVCPVGATFKRTDGIVLVDADQCIGCKFCISACPYSARIFNWSDRDSYETNSLEYSPETQTPGQMGTVSKCDFCPDRAREGKLPYCASSCPMGAIYFGDINEDTITNGEETLRFKETIANRAGYVDKKELGTMPNTYYLPPANRSFDYEKGFKFVDEDRKKRYEESIKSKS